MNQSISGDRPPNAILAGLPESEFRLIARDLVPVELVSGHVLSAEGGALTHAIFPVDGAVSMVTVTEEGGSVEAVLIGNDGVVGSWIPLGSIRSPWRVVVPLSGRAIGLSLPDYRSHLESCDAFRASVLRSSLASHVLTSRSAACNRFHEIPARAARWFLYVSDVTGRQDLRITQEFLGQMLGVQRSGVNIAISALAGAGLISHQRQVIRVLDRAGLEGAACECYATMREYAARLHAT